MQLLYEIGILEDYGHQYRWSNSGEFLTYFTINTLLFVLNGFIAGLIIVFFLLSWIRNRSYSWGLIFGMTLYTLIFFLMTCFQNYFVVDSLWDGSQPFATAYIKGLKDYFFSFEFVRIFSFWLLMLIATLITLFVNDKYGPGIFRKFLSGRYFEPRSEERIFMFLDLKGSTEIAERIGEHKYFRFLQKVFKDITPVLLETKAEVYQYVGDEIVLSWPLKKGIQSQNCIRCYNGIAKLLKASQQQYKEEFEAIAEFKAGLHAGSATVGEIGVLKRDIVYSGDLLNTTARLRDKCNDFGVGLLLSETLLAYFPEARLKVRSMGKVELRGKSTVLTLYALA